MSNISQKSSFVKLPASTAQIINFPRTNPKSRAAPAVPVVPSAEEEADAKRYAERMRQLRYIESRMLEHLAEARAEITAMTRQRQNRLQS